MDILYEIKKAAKGISYGFKHRNHLTNWYSGSDSICINQIDHLTYMGKKLIKEGHEVKRYINLKDLFKYGTDSDIRVCVLAAVRISKDDTFTYLGHLAHSKDHLLIKAINEGTHWLDTDRVSIELFAYENADHRMIGFKDKVMEDFFQACMLEGKKGPHDITAEMYHRFSDGLKARVRGNVASIHAVWKYRKLLKDYMGLDDESSNLQIKLRRNLFPEEMAEYDLLPADLQAMADFELDIPKYILDRRRKEITKEIMRMYLDEIGSSSLQDSWD